MHSDTDQACSHAASSEDLRTRASLLQRVRDWRDEASWRDFFATYSKFIYSIALKHGLTDSEAEEVVQGTMVGVASAIRDFHYNRETGSFRQWIGNQAKWRIQDQIRRTRRGVPINAERNDMPKDRTATLHRLPDERDNLELFLERDWHEAVAATALARVKRRVKPKHFQMFDLYAVKQWPLRRVSRTMNVNVAQVYLVKSRISLMLKQETRQVKAQLERLPDPDFFETKPK